MRQRGRLFWGVVVPAVVVFLGVLGGIGFATAIHMPKIDLLEDFTPNLITQIRDSDGEMFADYAKEKRVLLKDGELPENIINAVLAAEDSNFFQHGGVDIQGVVRAIAVNLTEGRRAMGASTITMQLARRLFLSPKKTWSRKIEEALLSVELEKNFSKQQILTLYCNLMFFGHGNYGVESASRDFFDKPTKDLTVPEAASLAGILQRPSSYSPHRRPDLVLNRRDYVLRRMLEEEFIDQAAYDEAIASELSVVPRWRREKELGAYFAEDVRIHLESRYGKDMLLKRGLQAHTTLDRRIQEATEQALRDGLRSLDRRRGWRGPIFQVEDEDLENHEIPSWRAIDLSPGEWNQGLVLSSDRTSARVKIGGDTFELEPAGYAWTGRRRIDRTLRAGDVAWFSFVAAESEDDPPILTLEQEPELEAAAIVLESATGAVRALVGGWDYERSKFNRATQAKRQVGSAFKVFVWGAALEMGYTAADTLFDSPTAYAGSDQVPNYSPRNNSREYYGIVTLRRGLEKSMNVTAVKLQDLVGVGRVIDFVRRCGVDSDLPPYPTLALGAAALLPIELAAAYAAIANQGVYAEPYLLERVTDPEGRVLEEHLPHAVKAMEPEIAYLLTHLLEGVIDRGTGISAAQLNADLAGKTGTTDLYTDAWFAGFSRRHTVLVWVGHDIPRTIGPRMTGAAAALPIWKAIVEDGIEAGWLGGEEAFVPPPGVVNVPVEYNTGLLPATGAHRIISEAFVAGTQPTRSYTSDWERILGLPWFQQRPFYLPKAGERMPEDVEDWSLIQDAWELKDEDD